MRSISAEATRAALDFPALVEALREGFRGEVEVPVRHHHTMARRDEPDATLLLMPAWQGERHVGVKIVTVTPGNSARSLPAVLGVYLLNDGRTGAPLALIDGPMLTLRRTAAASALAADYLAKPGAERLLMVGTGALAPHLIEAHAAVRPIRSVTVWGRSREKAEAVIAQLALPGVELRAVEDLEAAVAEAEVISCATLSSEPLVRGDWLRPGHHLDLVGAFTPQMRESDDEAVRRARVFVDTRAGCLKEGGDIVQPLAAGVIGETDVVADLFELTRGQREGRGGDAEITLFKSVGTALEDFAAAQLVMERS